MHQLLLKFVDVQFVRYILRGKRNVQMNFLSECSVVYKRKRMSDEKIQPIIDWIKNEGCPVKSGRTYHQLQNTKQQSFETFQQTNTHRQNPISYKYYRGLLKEIRVRANQKYMGHFECKVCGFYEVNKKELKRLEDLKVVSR